MAEPGKWAQESTTARLRDRKGWPTWFNQYKIQCEAQELWTNLDPDAPDSQNLMRNAPKRPPTIAELKARAASLTPTSTASSSTLDLSDPAVKLADVSTEFNLLHKEYQVELAIWTIESSKYKVVWNWVHASVDQKLLEPIELTLGSGLTLQKIVRALKVQLAPSATTTEITVRQEYRQVLERARTGRVNQGIWYQDWVTALARARAYNVPDVQGPLAIRDFLTAVSEKLAPDWGRTQLIEVIGADELGTRHRTLDQYGNWFSALAHENTLRANTRAPAIFATIGDRDSETPDPGCPCGADHKWKPMKCWTLELAITGTTERPMGRTPSKERLKKIQEALQQGRFKNLRKELENKGWKLDGNTSSKKSPDPSYPGSINAALINPDLLAQSAGIYATREGSPHYLSKSTLLDNCGSMHLVNSPDLLDPGSFERTKGRTVEAGVSSIPISGFGKRTMKNLLNGARGPGTEDLVLSEVALVEGFHVNIVSEALLLEKKVWYSGFDCTLKYGEPSNSVVIKKLERRFQLVFVEYKRLSSYSPAPHSVTLICATLRSLPFRRSSDSPRPREDSEHLWHARAGHLGQDALRALVFQARGVRINGTRRIECEHCSTAHAKQIISRRASERISPRPFWRVTWDLFDFKEGYDGSSWLLVIKDEFSGKLFGHALKSKALLGIHHIIRELDNWVKRQYGLSICVLKHDNDTAVIARKGMTTYQLWAKEEGITLELSPTYTHESNGGAERAGQEVITKAIKMSLGANLPESLWPETTLAAIYLLNISPSAAHGMRSPHEILYSWFRTYFRWYAPQLVYNHLADLKPDWSGIYAYGARAYPLMKAREAGKDKRAFKTSPRGHIGYLVGYVSSNIYRIWVPKLDRVIITRNVVFDENKSYSPKLEDLEEAPEQTNSALQLIEINEDEIQDAVSTLASLIDLEDEPTSLVAHGPQQKSSEASQLSSGVDKAGGEVATGLLTPERTPSIMAQEDVVPEAHLMAAQPACNDQAALARNLRNPLVAGLGYDTTGEPVSGSLEPGNGPSQVPIRKGSRNRKPTAKKAGIYAALREFDNNEERIGNFLDTYFPDQLIEEDRKNDHQTMHAVIAAAVLQNEVKRPEVATGEHQSTLPKAPRTWKDLHDHRYGDQFKEDAQLEIRNLGARNCWEVTPITKDTGRLLPLKWVFTYKVDSQGLLQRCRSRIVVRGDLQEEDTILSTYAATLAARSFRLAMGIAAKFDLEIDQYDVVNAFINAKREKSSSLVYCQLPDGFKEFGKCARVDRALYGLRDSPALWYKDLCRTLTELRLCQCKEDHCIFVDELRKVFLLFFVDDVLIMYHKDDQSQAQDVVQGLKRAYELREMGEAKWFLGIRIMRNRALGTLVLTHETYIEKIAHKFGLATLSSPSTPLPILELTKNKDQATPLQVKAYQEIVGSILYTGIMIRADVAYAASVLSHHLTNPSAEHMAAANWAIRYLFGSRFLAIRYCRDLPDQQLVIASDASFADDIETRRSSQGYTISLFGGLIAWRAARQATVTTSTTEAELRGVSDTAREIIALQRLFGELRLELGESWTILCDNQQTIRLVVGENERITTKLRHVDIQNMWLRQEHQKGLFDISYVPTNEMPADGLTKNLPRFKFERFKALLNFYNA